MSNTTFDDQEHTLACVAAENLGAIIFQDCQFLVYKAINIESKYVPEIRMANCLISAMTELPGYNSDGVFDSSSKVLLRVTNVTIYANNAFYTSGDEDFDYYIGNRIVVRESVYASGIVTGPLGAQEITTGPGD